MKRPRLKARNGKLCVNEEKSIVGLAPRHTFECPIYGVIFINTYLVQCPSLNRITLGHHKSENNNRMIQLTDVFCVLFRYNGTSNI